MIRIASVALLATLPVLAQTPTEEPAAPVTVEQESVAVPTPAEDEPSAHPEAQPEQQSEIQPQVQPESQPETQAEPQPQVQPQPQPQVQPQPQPQVQPEAQPEEQPQPEPQQQQNHLDSAYRGIVKIEVAVRKPDYGTPWQTGRYGRSTGTGFMVSPGVFMTNAHVVADAERIYVSPYADARKLKAKVKYVAHDADLAMIEVEDAEAFAGVPCLEFCDTLPKLEDAVRAIGYPIGGNRLSVTRGIVSRIDTTTYAHPMNEDHLTVQVDAAINPGNSGGPVLMGDKVVGVAFQGLMEANSTGYMIPIPVIKRFLKDVEDGRYDSYVDLGVSFMPLINPAMRKHYNLPDNAMGTLVAEVVRGGCSDGALHAGDVVLAVNGHAVDSSGMIELDGERMKLEELAERSFKDDALQFTVLRNNSEQTVVVHLAPLTPYLILGQEYDALPRYVHFGGLVFQPLHRNVIGAHSINSSEFNLELTEFLRRGGSIETEDLVVLTKVLKDEVNARFNDYGRRLVTRVNGEEVKGLRHLHSLLYPTESPRPAYTVIEFAGGKRPLVIDNAVIDAANERISAGYSVPASAQLQ